MTDEAVQEIYALARNAFMGGQREFPVHAFPFRMTAQNLSRHANNKWIDFWKNLKVGHDYFTMHSRPPVVAVSGNQYVFFDTEGLKKEFVSKSTKHHTPSTDPILITGWRSASLR